MIPQATPVPQFPSLVKNEVYQIEIVSLERFKFKFVSVCPMSLTLRWLELNPVQGHRGLKKLPPIFQSRPTPDSGSGFHTGKDSIKNI